MTSSSLFRCQNCESIIMGTLTGKKKSYFLILIPHFGKNIFIHPSAFLKTTNEERTVLFNSLGHASHYYATPSMCDAHWSVLAGGRAGSPKSRDPQRRGTTVSFQK